MVSSVKLDECSSQTTLTIPDSCGVYNIVKVTYTVSNMPTDKVHTWSNLNGICFEVGTLFMSTFIIR